MQIFIVQFMNNQIIIKIAKTRPSIKLILIKFVVLFVKSCVEMLFMENGRMNKYAVKFGCLDSVN